MTNTETRVVFVGGPSGTGKTTIGSDLAAKLRHLGHHSVMIEGDDYHPAANIEKMSNGIPLTDDDRWPWLEHLCEVVKEKIKGGGYEYIIVTCSMLREKYRDFIKAQFIKDGIDISLIVLQNTFENVLEQMKRRKGHFFKENMLRSQFDTFEIPNLNNESHVSIVSCSGVSINEIVDTIIDKYL